MNTYKTSAAPILAAAALAGLAACGSTASATGGTGSNEPGATSGVQATQPPLDEAKSLVEEWVKHSISHTADTMCGQVWSKYPGYLVSDSDLGLADGSDCETVFSYESIGANTVRWLKTVGTPVAGAAGHSDMCDVYIQQWTVPVTDTSGNASTLLVDTVVDPAKPNQWLIGWDNGNDEASLPC